jgi:mannose/fructose-specific phosphotransferase system component IIA
MAGMIRALVMTHGRIGHELVNVVEMILGPIEGLEALSNHGLSGDDLQESVRAWLGLAPATPGEPEPLEPPAVIFIDDFGGSCGTAAQLCCGPRPGVAIVSGVNLSMLLGFVTWREDSDLDELVAQIVKKGREAIVRLGN